MIQSCLAANDHLENVVTNRRGRTIPSVDLMHVTSRPWNPSHQGLAWRMRVHLTTALSSIHLFLPPSIHPWSNSADILTSCTHHGPLQDSQYMARFRLRRWLCHIRDKILCSPYIQPVYKNKLLQFHPRETLKTPVITHIHLTTRALCSDQAYLANISIVRCRPTPPLWLQQSHSPASLPFPPPPPSLISALPSHSPAVIGFPNSRHTTHSGRHNLTPCPFQPSNQRKTLPIHSESHPHHLTRTPTTIRKHPIVHRMTNRQTQASTGAAAAAANATNKPPSVSGDTGSWGVSMIAQQHERQQRGHSDEAQQGRS